MTTSSIPLILLIILVGIPLAFFMEAFWLWLTTKIFKVENATYKKALKVSTIFLLAGMIIGVVIAILFFAIKLFIIGIIANVIVGFFISNFLYKKYYLTETKKNIWIYIVKSIFGNFVAPLTLGFVIILPIRMYIVQPFFVQGVAMNPNFRDGQYLLIKEYDKDFQRGDVVIARNPKDMKGFVIKRIVGLPGETVVIDQGAITINGKALDESSYLNKDVKTNGSVNLTLVGDEYFMMGDNREFSSDSRAWGPVKKSLITGKYWITVYGGK